MVRKKNTKDHDPPKNPKGKKQPPPKVKVCPFCGKVGHMSRNSKKCGRSYRKKPNNADPVPGTGTDSGTSAKDLVQCASCGESGHRRASYKNCPHHQLRAAERSTGLAKKDRQTYSIKRGFGRMCKNDVVFRLVNEDVRIISRFLIHSSYLIEYCVRDPKRWLVTEWMARDDQPDIRILMMHLTHGFTPRATTRPDQQFYRLLEEYLAMREEHSGEPLYDNTHRTPLYEQACAEFTRNFATNVTTHAGVRVRNYLIKIVGMPRKEACDSVDALFETNKRPEIVGDQEDNPFNGFEVLDFTKIYDKWWQFVGFYQRLQQRMLEPATEAVRRSDEERRLARAERAKEREARNPRKGKSLAKVKKKKNSKVPAAEAQTWGKGFVLVPIYNVGAKHLTYDSGAVHKLCIRAEDASDDETPAFPESPEPVYRNPGAYSNDPLFLWNKCFDIPQRLIEANKFTCSISTNGVDVSIHCARPKPNDGEDDTSAKRRKITAKGKAKTGESVQRRPLRDHGTDYTRMVGIDPGKKIACGGVVRTSDDETNAVDKRDKSNQQRICLSSAAFRFNSGYHKREKQRVKLTGAVDTLRQNLLAEEQFLELNTMDPEKYRVVTEYRLRQFAICQSTYEKRAVTRLHWQKKWRTQQTVDKLVNYLCTGETKLVQKSKTEKTKRIRKKKKPAEEQDQDPAMALVEELAGHLSIDEDSEDDAPDLGTKKRPQPPTQAATRLSDDFQLEITAAASTSSTTLKSKSKQGTEARMISDDEWSSNSDFEIRRPESGKTAKGKGPAKNRFVVTSKMSSKTRTNSDDDWSSDDDFETRPPKSTKTTKGKGPAKTSTKKPESLPPKPSMFTEARQETKATTSSASTTKRKAGSGQQKVTTLVVLGEFNIPKHVRGRPGAPLTKLKKRFMDRAYRGQQDVDIVIVDEFRTTMCCSQCNRKCTKISTGRDRFLYCARCGITWNRDVNAGQNILNLGLVRKGLVLADYMPDVANFGRDRRVAQ